jgi:coenzyme F420-0:L-glutamate ligase / coenzyme F420-1:gamma-L-glutamate ligase
MSSLSLRPLQGIPEVRAGDDLAAAIVAALGGDYPPERAGGLVLALAHTVVSKAEGAVVELASVDPGEQAVALAAQQDKDARLVQVVLDQSAELLRAERGVLICRTHHGFVCANAGVDASNAGAADRAIVLPADPDGSARAIRARIAELTGAAPPAVLITDSFGRPWRHGQVDVAVGLAGLAPLDDWRGRRDVEGMELRATWPAIADAAAAAADLVRAKDSREPVVAIEGLERFITAEDGPGAAALLRTAAEDLFL